MTIILPPFLIGFIPCQSQGKAKTLVRWKNVAESRDFGEDRKKAFVIFAHGLIANFLTNKTTGEDHD